MKTTDKNRRRKSTKSSAGAHDLPAPSFRDVAFQKITWLSACVEESEGELEWTDTRRLFDELESAFDPDFHDVNVSDMTATGDAENQSKSDAQLEERQAQLAASLWKLDPGLAKQYADVLRRVRMPLGLPDVEKRVAFLEAIEQLTANKKPTRKFKPAPYNITQREAFATLWIRERNNLMKSPRTRDFLAKYKKELNAINVYREGDVVRIRNAARIAKEIPPWNTQKGSRTKGRTKK